MTQTGSTGFHDGSFQEHYLGHILTYRPFRHEDGSFSMNASISREGELITSYARTSAEQSFATTEDAANAGRQWAREFLDEHIPLWKGGEF